MNLCKAVFVALLLMASAPLMSAQSGVSYVGDPPHAKSFSSGTRVVIAGTYQSTAVNGGVSLNSIQFIAQGFHVPTQVYAGFAELILTDTEGASFLVQFTNAIGPKATAANVLASAEFQGGSVETGVRFFLPLNFVLPRGEYYLVFSATGSNAAAQPFFGGFGLPNYRPLPDTIGSPDSSFYTAYNGRENPDFPPASNWKYQAPESPIEFQVRGVTK